MLSSAKWGDSSCIRHRVIYFLNVHSVLNNLQVIISNLFIRKDNLHRVVMCKYRKTHHSRVCCVWRVRGRRGGQEGGEGGRYQTLSPSSAEPRCASVPMETGGVPGLLQSHPPSVRGGESRAGGRTQPTSTLTTGKVGKHIWHRMSLFLVAYVCF